MGEKDLKKENLHGATHESVRRLAKYLGLHFLEDMPIRDIINMIDLKLKKTK